MSRPSSSADRPPSECVQEEERVCARAAAEPGARVVSPGGEREEEGGGLEQPAHTHGDTAAERAAGNTQTRPSGAFISNPIRRQSSRPPATTTLRAESAQRTALRLPEL